MLPRLIIAVATALLIYIPSVISNDLNTFQNGLQILSKDSQQGEGQVSSRQLQQCVDGSGGQQQTNAQQAQGQQIQSQQSQQGQASQLLRAQQSQGQSSAAAGGQCFFPNGSPDPSGIPCFTDDNTSRCCGQDEICSTNKLCVSKKDPNKFTRRSCVDQTFQSGDCPNVCQGVNDTEIVDVLPCGAPSLGQFCCDEGQGFQCCSIPEKVLTLGKSNTFSSGAPAAPASGLTDQNRSAANSNKGSSSTQGGTSQVQTSQAQQSQSRSSQSHTSQIQTSQTQTAQVTQTETQVSSAIETVVRTSVSIQVITSQVPPQDPPQAPPSASTSIILVTSIQAITSATDATSPIISFTSAQQSFNSQQSSTPGSQSSGSAFQTQNSPHSPQSSSTSPQSQPSSSSQGQNPGQDSNQNHTQSDQPSNQQDDDSNPSSPAAAIGGSVVGGLAFLAILAYAIYFFRKRASKRSSAVFESSLGNTNLSDRGKASNTGFRIISDTYPKIKEMKTNTQHSRSDSAPGIDAVEDSVPIVRVSLGSGSWYSQDMGEVRNEEGGKRDQRDFI